MKTQMMLMSAALAAGVVSPVLAQGAAAAPASAVEQSMERPVHFDALNTLPASTEAWVAINMRNVNDAVMKAFPKLTNYPMWLHLLDSVAIGTKVGSLERLREFVSHYSGLFRLNCVSAIVAHGELLGPNAQVKLQRFESMYTQLSRRNNNVEQHSAGLAENYPWDDISVSLKPKPGCEPLLSILAEKWRLGIQEEYMANGLEIPGFEANGWRGLTFTSKCLAGILKSAGIELAEELLVAPLHVAYKMQGGSLLIGMSSDLETLTNRGGEETTVQQTDEVKFISDACSGNALAAWYMSPEALNMAGVTTKIIMNEAANVLKMAVKVLVSSRPQGAAVIKDAENGIEELRQQLSRLLLPDNTLPATFVAWNDGDVHLLFESDAHGGAFVSSELPLLVEDESIVTLRTSALTSPRLPELNKLIPAVQSIANAVELSFDDECVVERRGFAEVSAYVLSGLSILNSTGRELFSTFSGGLTFTVDAQSWENMSLSSDADCTETFQLQQPRLALNMPLTSGPLFEQRWRELQLVSQGVISLTDNSAANELARAWSFDVSTVDEKTRVYRHKNGPGYVVSDAGLTVCSDMSNAVGLFDVAQRQPMCGMEIELNLKPLEPALENNDEYFERLANYHNQKLQASGYEACVEPLSLEKNLESHRELMQQCSGASVKITTENGKLRMHARLETPCLK
ncbi:MAG: hypothetical protein IKW48_07405 [Akkermansia sp.]|nr:hypothetical protein [Akkermansia sp.]